MIGKPISDGRLLSLRGLECLMLIAGAGLGLLILLI
jgi:hypothetical protein